MILFTNARQIDPETMADDRLNWFGVVVQP